MAGTLHRVGKVALALVGCAAVMTTTAAAGTAATGTAPAGNAVAGNAAGPGSPGRILVDGQVADRRTFTFDQLRALPQHSLTMTIPDPEEGPQQHTVTGPRLVDVALAARPRFDTNVRNSELRFFVAVNRADGLRVVASWAELDPRWAPTPALLALTLDGVPLDDQGARLVTGSDVSPGRLISPVTRIYVGDPNRMIWR